MLGHSGVREGAQHDAVHPALQVVRHVAERLALADARALVWSTEERGAAQRRRCRPRRSARVRSEGFSKKQHDLPARRAPAGNRLRIAPLPRRSSVRQIAGFRWARQVAHRNQVRDSPFMLGIAFGAMPRLAHFACHPPCPVYLLLLLASCCGCRWASPGVALSSSSSAFHHCIHVLLLRA